MIALNVYTITRSSVARQRGFKQSMASDGIDFCPMLIKLLSGGKEGKREGGKKKTRWEDCPSDGKGVIWT